MIAIIKFIIAKFWPVLIPLLLYFIWLAYARIKNKSGEKIKFLDGPVKTLFISMVITAFLCVIYIFVTTTSHDKKYVPIKIENGKLIPSHIE